VLIAFFFCFRLQSGSRVPALIGRCEGFVSLLWAKPGAELLGHGAGGWRTPTPLPQYLHTRAPGIQPDNGPPARVPRHPLRPPVVEPAAELPPSALVRWATDAHQERRCDLSVIAFAGCPQESATLPRFCASRFHSTLVSMKIVDFLRGM